MSLPTMRSPDVREGDMEAAIIERHHPLDNETAYYLVRGMRVSHMVVRRLVVIVSFSGPSCLSRTMGDVVSFY